MNYIILCKYFTSGLKSFIFSFLCFLAGKNGGIKTTGNLPTIMLIAFCGVRVTGN